jgi:hypothetical protein
MAFLSGSFSHLLQPREMHCQQVSDRVPAHRTNRGVCGQGGTENVRPVLGALPTHIQEIHDLHDLSPFRPMTGAHHLDSCQRYLGMRQPQLGTHRQANSHNY